MRWAHECALKILASQPGVRVHGRSTPAWGITFPEPPATVVVHFAPGILEGLSPTGAGHPWHEAVWSREMSGAVVHIWCHWVSHFSLCRLVILSTPFGLLPLWEVSQLRGKSLQCAHQEHIPPSDWLFLYGTSQFVWLGALLEMGIVVGLYPIWKPVHLREPGLASIGE